MVDAGKDLHQPLMPGILKGLYNNWGSICTSAYEECLFHTAALLAFLGALRISELVAGSKWDKSGRALEVDDVSQRR